MMMSIINGILALSYNHNNSFICMPGVNRPFRKRRFSCIICYSLLCTSMPVHAGYKDDIGYTRLVSELGAGMPDGSSVPVTQAEAATAFVNPPDNDPVYLPDPGNAQFSGKAIAVKSGSDAGTYSSHASSVGRIFYGNTSSIAPGVIFIDAFWANHWLQSGFLKSGSSTKPLASASRIANHSWIGDAGDPAINSDMLRRTDWVIATDEYIQCVGVKNSASANQPLLSGAYNVIVVGKSDGLNGFGTGDIDSDYLSGRTRPELVAPENTSSAATPVVAASAALLIEHGEDNPGLSTDPLQPATSNRKGDTIHNTGRSEVIKAILMAGANRSTANTSAADITDYRVDPDNRTINGLDRRFGAGQIDIYNSFRIMQAGEQNSNEDSGLGSIASDGFDYDPSFGGFGAGNSTASYYFSTNAGPVMFSATLAWNINIDGGNGPHFSGSAELYDLDLVLYDIAGSPVLIESSSSTIDNTENIWTVLPAGRDYLLQVVTKSGQGAFDWDYALAWHMVNLVDTDGDGIPDITDTDDDNDELDDIDEITAGTDPLNPDMDGDGFIDGTEVLAGTDPLDNTDYPEWGDINGDGTVDTADVILAMQAATGLTALDTAQLARGNVAPLVNATPQSLPSDTFNTADVLLIRRKSLGEVNF